jgi:hypothetical protein
VVIKIRAAQLGPGGASVTLLVGSYKATKPLTMTASGLIGPSGATLTSMVTKL